jgi:hypothetical protein
MNELLNGWMGGWMHDNDNKSNRSVGLNIYAKENGL